MDFYKIAEFDPESKFIYNSICFDSFNGSGNTPNGANINYMGLVAFMPPKKVVDASFKRVDVRSSQEWFEENLPRGHCIAPPQLMIQMRGDSFPHVVSHEGRHRSDAMANLDIPLVPVQIFILDENERYLRAKSLTEDHLKKIDGILMSQDNNVLMLGIRYFIFDENVLVLVSSQKMARVAERQWNQDLPIIVGRR